MKKLLFVVLVFGTVFFTSCENDLLIEENDLGVKYFNEYVDDPSSGNMKN